MTFKEQLDHYGITPEQVAEESGLKLNSVKIYAQMDRPSKRCQEALDKLIDNLPDTAHPQSVSSTGEEECPSSSPTCGLIVEIPRNQYMRIVKLDNGDRVKAWCKKDRYTRKGINVKVKLEMGKFYIKGEA